MVHSINQDLYLFICNGISRFIHCSQLDHVIFGCLQCAAPELTFRYFHTGVGRVGAYGRVIIVDTKTAARLVDFRFEISLQFTGCIFSPIRHGNGKRLVSALVEISLKDFFAVSRNARFQKIVKMIVAKTVEGCGGRREPHIHIGFEP